MNPYKQRVTDAVARKHGKDGVHPPAYALSLWQPWATAIAHGEKRIETRCWSTNFRGPLLIHAAQHVFTLVDQLLMHEQPYFNMLAGWLRDTYPMESKVGLTTHDRILAYKKLPRGCIVASAWLRDCLPVEDPRVSGFLDKHPDERGWGDYSHGRFAWMLDTIIPFAKPVSCHGAQGLFLPSPDVLALAFDQIQQATKLYGVPGAGDVTRSPDTHNPQPKTHN